MAEFRFSGSLQWDFDPFLNRTFDGALKLGSVAAAKVAAEDIYGLLKQGRVSNHNFEHTLDKMCKDAAYWGTIGGVYAGIEYGVEKIRGTRDWKNAMISGASLVSAAANNNRDQIVMDAITGGAVATAAEFLSHRG